MSIQVAVLTTPAPKDVVAKFFDEHLIIDDGILFHMLNTGYIVNGKNIKISQDDLIGSFENTLCYLDAPHILVHTFNPLVINALEVVDDDPQHLRKIFYIYSNLVGFNDLMKHKSLIEKTQVMSIGEAIIDTIMSIIINDFEKGENLIED